MVQPNPYGMTKEYLAESAKAYKALLWYGWAGLALALLVPVDTLLQGSQLFRAIFTAFEPWLPVHARLVAISPQPDLIRFWLGAMYVLLPFAITHFFIKWPVPPNAKLKQSIVAIFLAPIAIAILAAGVFFVLYEPTIREHEALTRGTAFRNSLLSSRLGLGLLGSVLFYGIAVYSGAWLKFVFNKTQRLITLINTLFSTDH